MRPTKQPIVITGCGWVTPFAAGAIDTVLAQGANLSTLSACDAQAPPARNTSMPSACGGTFWAVDDALRKEYPDLPKELRSQKGAWLPAIAVEHARRDAGITSETVANTRLGMVVGCALAGQQSMIDFACDVRKQTARFVSPIRFPQTVGNYTSGALARAYCVLGPNMTVASGLASGLDAMVEACGVLRRGDADVMMAGGADTLSAEMAESLADGRTVLSEGACFFIMETARHAAQRGVSVVATITDVRHEPTAQAHTPDPSGVIVSSAGGSLPGAIRIEHWVGRCLAALGPSCVAAAIGAAKGCAVPVVDGDGTSCQSVMVRASSSAYVTVESENGQRTVMELALPGGG